MLRVKTRIGTSKIHGIGLFADQFIAKGTVTWQYDPKFDICFTQKQINSLPKLRRDFMRYYCYFDHKLKKYILCGDNQKYINHIKNTKRENIHSTPKRDVAARDIKPGEELLCDYNKFDPLYFKRMHIKYEELK